ncbi:MAG: F0F1 ATP synthase subunit B [Gammaproteobacteria bacterium]
MSIGATLLGQMITFLLFALFTMRFVWPPIQQALAQRQAKIADGLAAAERGHHDFALAKESAAKHLKETKLEVGRLIDEAKRQADKIIDEAKLQAREEGQKLIKKAEAEIEQLSRQARDSLRDEVGAMVLLGTERLLEKNLDASAHQQLLKQLVEEL